MNVINDNRKPVDQNTKTLNVMVYNIFSPVPEPLRFYGQSERCARVKDVIQELDQKYHLDVIVLNEVIAPETQTVIFRDMPLIGFKYRTRKITEAFTVHGGIVLFSKHPITQESFTVFGDKCVGIDCFAAKGVVFARINKDGMYFNVFGTHLQAWPSIKAYSTRELQMRKMREFIDKIKLPEDEPVILAGDMNTDLYLDKDHVQHMLYHLEMGLPETHTESHPFTVDPKENKLVGNDDPSEYVSDSWPNGCVDEYYRTLECPCCPAQWIDYTLYSKRHLLPLSCDTRVIKTKVPPFKIKINASQEATIQDVSDHFPVLGHFVFPTKTKLRDADRISDIPLKLVTDTNTNVVTISIIIAVVGIIVLVCGWFAVRGTVFAKTKNSDFNNTTISK